MKSDTERKRFHKEKNHRRKKRMNVHLSKDLRTKLKSKKRSLLVRKDDRVRVMRGPGKGKEGRVARVNIIKRKVYVDGVTVTNAKGREVLVAVQPSNLMLVSLEPTEIRKMLFSDAAFKVKKEEKQPEHPKEKVSDVQSSPQQAVAKTEKARSKPDDNQSVPVKPAQTK